MTPADEQTNNGLLKRGNGRARRVLLLGATGTIGRAAAKALVTRGAEVFCLIRPGADGAGLEGAVVRHGEATDSASLRRNGFGAGPFDAVVSCLASRNGAPADAWAIDYAAHAGALAAAQEAGVSQFVLLSAICVQKPQLAFQRAKLTFEKKLADSGLDYSIVRPTAYFKSLSGQVERVRAGKPFMLFGDGTLTATKPISDNDLAAFIADCLFDPSKRNRILPVGGPGPAITPREQGEKLFALLGREPRFQSVPPAMLDVVAGALSIVGAIAPPVRARAEFARIGRYYATESMLVWDDAKAAYDADATPETGSETLFDFYERLVKGDAEVSLGAHKAF